MSDLNFDLLQENIRKLIRNNGITQQELATIAAMSQANVSKALNPKESKQFTLNQLFRISQHFGVSLDVLTGNTTTADASTCPRAVFAFITKLLCEHKLRASHMEVKEEIFEPYMNEHGFPDCSMEYKHIKYPAFYFPSYDSIADYATDEYHADELQFEFQSGGNETKFKSFNEIIEILIPIIEMYLKGKIEDEPFQMILNGYLEKL